MRRETVRCSLPLALSAPSAVPTMEQQMPTKAIITMNHRIDTVCVTCMPQQFLDGSASAAAADARTQWSLWKWCSAAAAARFAVGECIGCAATTGGGGGGGGPDGRYVEGEGRMCVL